MNLTLRRSAAVAAVALAGALAAPATAGNAAPARPAATCAITGYAQPVLVLVSNVTIKGGATEHLTVLNTQPCTNVRMRVYHGGQVLFDKTTKSDNNGKALFNYKVLKTKNRLLFGGFFPAEATGQTQFKIAGAQQKFDKKTKFFVV